MREVSDDQFDVQIDPDADAGELLPALARLLIAVAEADDDERGD